MKKQRRGENVAGRIKSKRKGRREEEREGGGGWEGEKGVKRCKIAKQGKMGGGIKGREVISRSWCTVNLLASFPLFFSLFQWFLWAHPATKMTLLWPSIQRAHVWNYFPSYTGYIGEMATGDKTEKPWKHDAKWTKPDTKGHMLYDSIRVKYAAKENSWRRQISDCQGLGYRGPRVMA